MSHLDILLPFALPPPALSKDLLSALKTPSLAMLLARGDAEPERNHDAFDRALPHERWLAKAFGLVTQSSDISSPPIAAQALQHFQLPHSEGVWFLLNPVHIHIARDHLVLTDRRRLHLSESASRALFAIAAPVFADYGRQVIYADADHWLLRADDWHALDTATPDAACGRNIDVWMPRGDSAAAWRKLQNEVQMHWHDCAVNQQREQQGLDPVNSVWLWGGATKADALATAHFSHTFGLAGWPAMLISRAQPPVQTTAEAAIAAQPQNGLQLLDALMEPALGEDMAEWLSRFNALEADWFAPLLKALRQGRLDRCRLILTDGTRSTAFAVSRNMLRRFWRTPMLNALLATGYP